jgi:hypothetical protein
MERDVQVNVAEAITTASLAVAPRETRARG